MAGTGSDNKARFYRKTVAEVSSQLRQFLKSDGESDTNEVIKGLRSLRSASNLAGYKQNARLAELLEQRIMQFPDSGNSAVLGELIDFIEVIAALESDQLPYQHVRLEELLKAPEGDSGHATPTTTKRPGLTERTKKGSPTRQAVGGISPTLYNMFRDEVATHLRVISEGVIQWEESGTDLTLMESLMRSAHSLKGAARIVGLLVVVDVAHRMEDIFQHLLNGGGLDIGNTATILLAAADFIQAVSELDADKLTPEHSLLVQGAQLSTQLMQLLQQRVDGGPEVDLPATPQSAKRTGGQIQRRQEPKGTIRINTDIVQRMISLSGELAVEAEWIDPYQEQLQAVKRRQIELVEILDRLDRVAQERDLEPALRGQLAGALSRASETRQQLVAGLAELDDFSRKFYRVTSRLSESLAKTKMIPFREGVGHFKRLVRDLGQELGKAVTLVLEGEETPVDRDIMERIDAPLNHLIRNALDHGIESSPERSANGKPAKATVVLSAFHVGGNLRILVRDDGRGIDVEKVKNKIVANNLAKSELVERLSEPEILEFLFLPGFSTKQEVTQVSGRGVGLDVAYKEINAVGGKVNVETKPGEGVTFVIRLPTTLSIETAMIVEAGGDLYGFPVAKIDKVVSVDSRLCQHKDGKEHCRINGRLLPTFHLTELLELGASEQTSGERHFILVEGALQPVAIEIERYLGRRELAVRPVDSRLGRLQDVASVAVLKNDDTVIMLDIDDLQQTISNRSGISRAPGSQLESASRRVLVVDDSSTVRTMVRTILEKHGYSVWEAVDGVDGLNQLRAREFQLLITDIDMPRMSGHELIRLLRADHRLAGLPVVILSYKGDEVERVRARKQQVSAYLTKDELQESLLIDTVAQVCAGSS